MNKHLAQMLKFGIIGAVNTGIDFGVFTLLTLCEWSYLPAQCLSYTCGVLNSYVMNRSWTFNERRHSKFAFFKFTLLNLFVLLVTSSLLALLHLYAGWSIWISKLCATGAGVLVNYLGSRLWVFGKTAEIERSEHHEN
jgi:putative flippase GtrA